LPQHFDFKAKSNLPVQSLKLVLTSLVYSTGNKSPKKKGKSKRAHVLVAAVERATANFVERGNQVKATSFCR
jgi:catenin alpha